MLYGVKVMSKIPSSLQNLIDQFTKLPGIGRKTAERLVFYLSNQPKAELTKFAQSLEQLRDQVTICQNCYNFAESSPCAICRDKNRDQTTLAVVAKPQDVLVLESVGEFKGVYHVLGNTLNTLEGRTPETLKIKELLKRLPGNKVKEVILALNPDLEGETTMLYLAKALKPTRVKVTRLARGLPMGSDIEYADQTTLSNALKGRREINNN